MTITVFSSCLPAGPAARRQREAAPCSAHRRLTREIAQRKVVHVHPLLYAAAAAPAHAVLPRIDRRRPTIMLAQQGVTAELVLGVIWLLPGGGIGIHVHS